LRHCDVLSRGPQQPEHTHDRRALYQTFAPAKARRIAAHLLEADPDDIEVTGAGF